MISLFIYIYRLVQVHIDIVKVEETYVGDRITIWRRHPYYCIATIENRDVRSRYNSPADHLVLSYYGYPQRVIYYIEL